MEITNTQDGWTSIKLDGRIHQLVLALAFKTALYQGTFERYDELKDKLTALETAVMNALSHDRDLEASIFRYADGLTEEYRRERLEDQAYLNRKQGNPPSFAAMTLPG